MSQRRPTEAEIDLYAQDVAITGDQVKAWRIAFPKSTATPEAQHTAASLMHKMPQVRNRIAFYVGKAAEIAVEDHGVTVNSLIAELEEARELGKANAQTSACVAATMGKAKLAGLDIDKLEISGSDMSPWASIGKDD